MVKEVSLNEYLKRAEQLKINPNFYLSEPYLLLSKAKCFIDNGWIWIESDGWCLFPPLFLSDYSLLGEYPNKNVWSDFGGVVYQLYKLRPSFLDWEYIFNPIDFTDLSGGKWNTYRKNIRKWPKSNENWVYCDRFDKYAAGLLLERWFNKKSDKVEDADLIADFVVFSDLPGIHRCCLYDKNEQLKAINVWDENWRFTNYRFCIVEPDESWLDEFARWLFFTDSEMQTGKLVCDGGTLGNVGLEMFKDKLNPLSKRKVFSWIKT
jgi:hypothetical protein